MRAADPAGWIYVFSHPAWARLGLRKIGHTSIDPARRLKQITSSSGLLAPGRVEFCIWVADRHAVEKAAHGALQHKRVRKRRELFRVDVAEAREAIEQAAATAGPSKVWNTVPRPAPLRRIPSRPVVYRGRDRSGHGAIAVAAIAAVCVVILTWLV